MRNRGAAVADIAILVVSAEDGVKPQTVEAWKEISEAKLPCIVAINKVDKPNANIEKTTDEILHLLGCKPEEIILASGKTGQGVDQILDQYRRT
jgi:translation initiation factor IF-2